jgi:hemerythrin-like metal-binding protein/PAS domain S-box-containing protein
MRIRPNSLHAAARGARAARPAEPAATTDRASARVARDPSAACAELRRSVEAMRAAEDAAGMCAWAWDAGSGELAWSDRCRALFGISPDASAGYDALLEAVHPDDRERADRALRAAADAGSGCDVDLRVLAPDGAVRWIRAKGNACAGGGSGRRVAGMAWDVTDRKLTEQALRDASRRKDEFLGVLSHELRNPLAPIRNSLHVLRHADPAGEPARRARAIIERQVDHLTRLVDDLLELKRISAGKMRLRRERLDLVSRVRETVEDLRPLFAQRRVALELQAPRAAMWVDADATRLAQVVANLLQNAVKFTDAGGRVSVALKNRSGTAILTVADDGVGMAPELIESLFEAFVQGEATVERSRSGLGLGLALVRGIVELHGGAVTARSDGPGKGSVFEIAIPGAGAPRAEPDRPQEGAPRSTARRRILIIEDSADAADSLREVLELEGGHEVHIAGDGLAGIAAARRLRPDVILCDIGLPGVDGYEVARTLREDGAASGARMVALSGYASPDDIERALLAGFGYHVAKPADMNRLLALVAEAAASRTPVMALPAEALTGHREVDSQHAALIDAIERMRRAGPDGLWDCLEFIDRHTSSHFAYEETLMDDVAYPHRDEHCEHHREFLDEFLFLRSRIERDGPTAENVGAFVNAAEQWVAHHVLRQDRRLAEFIRERRALRAI